MSSTDNERRFVRGKFGFDQNLVLLASLCAFVLAYLCGSINDSSAGKRFELLKDTSVFLTARKIVELTGLSKEPNANADLEGDYSYLVDYGSGQMLRGDIYIDEHTITRSITINHYSMHAEANYEIVGSTIQYSGINGDRYLFSENGTAIGIDTEYGHYLEIDGDMKLFVETNYTKENYKPLSKKSDLSLLQRARLLTVWGILQMIFAFTGIGVLFYVLVKLYKDSREIPTQPEDNVLTA